MIRHLAGIAEIVDDIDAAVQFYRSLGLTVQHEAGSPYATVDIPGALHFGLWLRRHAADAVFGSVTAVDRIPLGFSVGFEVNAVEATDDRFTALGHELVQPAQVEPWGQTTSRFFSPSGALCEFSVTPWARRLAHDAQAATE